MTNIKFIYFDLGGVIVTDSFRPMAKKLAKEYGLDEEKIFQAYVRTTSLEYSQGKVIGERWVYFFQEIGVDLHDLKKFLDKWHKTFLPIKETITIIKKISKKHKVGLLADQPKDLMPYFKKLGILKLFKTKVISCEVGAGKEQDNLEIYKIAIEKAGVKAQDILFIDDREKNIRNAEKLGMQTLLFVNPEKLKEDLNEKNLM
jgi:putative hydrolase of the HAD superfamily